MNSKMIDMTSWYGPLVCLSCSKVHKQGVVTWFESYRGASVKISLCKDCAKEYANRLIEESERSRESAKEAFYKEDQYVS